MVMAKWDRELGAVGGQVWSQACKHVHAIHDTKLRTFHLLFINQGYALNDRVFHFLNVGPQCRLCGQERETYVHLLWNYVFVQLIIDTAREVGINYLDQEEEWLTQKSFLLGTSPTLLPKTVALLGKRFIFFGHHSLPNPPPIPYTPLALFAIWENTSTMTNYEHSMLRGSGKTLHSLKHCRTWRQDTSPLPPWPCPHLDMYTPPNWSLTSHPYLHSGTNHPPPFSPHDCGFNPFLSHRQHAPQTD